MNNETNSIIVDEEKYEELLKMLNSGVEDRLLAFEIINKLDFQKNLLVLALLRKEATCSSSDWNIGAPILTQFLYSKNIPDYVTPSFMDLFSLVKKQGANFSNESKMLLINRYVRSLLNILSSMDIVESISFDVKFKKHE